MNKPKDYVELREKEIYHNPEPKFYPGKPKEREGVKLLDKMLKSLDDNNKKLRIKRVSNGYLVEYPNDNGGDLPASEVYVYDSLMGDNKEQLVWMLNTILKWMGCDGSRHDYERIRVKLEHGDKWICKDKKCKICRG